MARNYVGPIVIQMTNPLLLDLLWSESQESEPAAHKYMIAPSEDNYARDTPV